MSNAQLMLTSDGIQQISTEFIRQVNIKIRSRIDTMKVQFIAAVLDTLRKDPTIMMLLGGGERNKIDAELGTNEIAQTTSTMIEIFGLQSQLIFIPFKPPGSSFGGIRLPAAVGATNIDGTFTFSIIHADFEAVTNLETASYISAPSREEIPWLRWLLIEGFKTIDNWEISYDLTNKQEFASRTKKAIMQRKEGEHWVVPEPFRGDNIDNNFVTRAIESANLEKVFTNILKRNIGS